MINKYKSYIFLLLSFAMVEMTSVYALGGEGEDLGSRSSSSKNEGPKFSTLVHDENDPDSYTLAYLDSGLIPDSKKVGILSKGQEFEPVKHWIKKEMLDDVEGEIPSKDMFIVRRAVTGGDPYFLVWLNLKQNISSSEQLTTRLWGGTERRAGEGAYSASMIIFPLKDSKHALVYLLGRWSQLLNPYAVTPDWGLRLSATKVIFSDCNIKSLLGKNNFNANPTSRKETKQRLAPIESFELEVGTEGLQSLTILPKYALGSDCQHLAVGRDWFKFFLPDSSDGKKGNTLTSLYQMAQYLYGVYLRQPTIHRKLRDYIDDGVRDDALIAQLNKHLERLLPTEEAGQFVFPAQTIWKCYGLGPSFRYKKGKQKKYLLETLRSKRPTLESTIFIKKARGDNQYSEPLCKLLYTLPLEYEEDFYRFDRGRWFKVAASRFNLIINQLRSPEVKVDIPALIPYTLEDATGEGEGGGLYQEDRYNRRVVAELDDPHLSALLLDRLNIYFLGATDKFEFGDILFYDDRGHFYIVHVKRKESGDIDHHRTQVERSAEYLATELNKENAEELLLQGCVNGLYIKHDVSIKKEKNQGKRLTHGSHFKAHFAREERGKQGWSTYLREKILKTTKVSARTLAGKLKANLREINLEFFEDHPSELTVVLDALHDCNEQEELEASEIEGFIEAAKQSIQARAVLFPKGAIGKAVRDKITIVMAVIDDRFVDKLAKKAQKKRKTAPKDRSKEGELFRKQEIWGLDRTRQLVQKSGFNFNLVVINENTDRPDWDAFGTTEGELDEEESENESEEDATPGKGKTDHGKDSTGKKESSESLDESVGDPSDASGVRALAQVAGYEYTSTDINRLLHIPLEEQSEGGDYERFSLSDAPVDEAAETNDVVHRMDNTYVLPPIIGHMDEHEQVSPSETLLELLANSFFRNASVLEYPPEELIIPFNPGGHWITFHILIPEGDGEITFKCIDSLLGDERKFSLLTAFLKGKYCPRHVNFEYLVSRMQPDSVSCGAMTVENIKNLFAGDALPDLQQYTLEDTLELKKTHQEYLKSIDANFDF